MEMSDLSVDTMRMIRIALEALSQRLIVLIALIMNCGVFVYAIYWDTWHHLAGAVGFGIVSWCLVMIRPKTMEV